MSEVKQRLTPRELAGWIALYEIDPWGDRRADIRHAVIGSALLSPWTKESVPAWKLIPEYDQGDEIERTEHDQRLGVEAMKAWARRHNEQNRKDSGK